MIGTDIVRSSYRELSRQMKVSGGTGVVSFGGPNSGRSWDVRRITIVPAPDPTNGEDVFWLIGSGVETPRPVVALANIGDVMDATPPHTPGASTYPIALTYSRGTIVVESPQVLWVIVDGASDDVSVNIGYEEAAQ